MVSVRHGNIRWNFLTRSKVSIKASWPRLPSFCTCLAFNTLQLTQETRQGPAKAVKTRVITVAATCSAGIQLTLPKEVGGLGISSTRHKNHAILMNQAWRLFSNSTSLWAQVLLAKYFPQGTLFTGPQTSRGSHIRTAISIGVNLLRGGMHWYIGDGQTIRIWQDPWLPNGTLRSYIEGPLPPHEEDQRINALWTNHSWSLDSLSLHLPPQLHSLIQGIPVARFA